MENLRFFGKALGSTGAFFTSFTFFTGVFLSSSPFQGERNVCVMKREKKENKQL